MYSQCKQNDAIANQSSDSVIPFDKNEHMQNEGYQQLIDEIVALKHILSGCVVQTLIGLALNNTVNSRTYVPKELLSTSTPLINGASWLNDAYGTLAIYLDDEDENTAIFLTKTTSVVQSD